MIVTDRPKPNRLIKEKSPYLLQHAYNPIDWYPWGSEAFERAKSEDKPIFLSIGYSSCHWCHVMEKESFEDTNVAALMNQTFVCIKVDREERPDLDAAYMAACQAMGRNCGWPLNVIMTPDKNPFFVASYIPRDNRFGNVGMLSLVPQIGEIWRTRRAEMESIGTEIKEQISSQPQTQQTDLDKSVLDNAYEQLFLRFDQQYAGFGRAPKFPSAHNLLFLLRYARRAKEKTALDMVDRTLRAMRLGGIFDQIGGGFHRYSTDPMWLVPHFEKMLYDQAMLALTYVEGYQALGAPRFKVTAKETLDYVLRELATDEGGFMSAEDADSEGEEGKFYLWSLQEIQEALSPEGIDFTVKLFDIKAEGNYVEAPKGRNGKNILHLATPLEQLAKETNLTMDQLIGKIGKITSSLYKVRERRVHPAKDDKILVDWNGLMIAALAKAARVFDDEKYQKAAVKNAEFILNNLKTAEGKLYHRYAKGEKAVEAFLDDYAFLTFGLIELYETTFEEKYLQSAIELTKTMIEEFWDKQAGGVYFTSKDAEMEVPRLKQAYDGALPSGNSVALLNLLRLSALSGDVTFGEYAQRLLSAFSEEITNQPLGYAFMLAGLDLALGPSLSVVIVGELEDVDTQAMLTLLRKHYLPNLTVTLWTEQKSKTAPPGISYEQIDEKATAYVCRGQTCMPPTNDPEKLKQLIETS